MNDMKYRARYLLHRLTLDGVVDEFDEKVNNIAETALLEAYDIGFADGKIAEASKDKSSFWGRLFAFYE